MPTFSIESQAGKLAEQCEKIWLERRKIARAGVPSAAEADQCFRESLT